MPVFMVLVFLAATIVWLLLSFLFRPVGGVGKRLLDDARNAMQEEDKQSEEEKE